MTHEKGKGLKNNLQFKIKFFLKIRITPYFSMGKRKKT